MSNITATELKRVLEYNKETGVFIRINGAVAASVNQHGYGRIYVLGKRYAAHRLAWLYVFGELPSQFIDHINMDRNDNRIANLRLCDRSTNAANTKSKRNGFKGVTKHKCGKFQVQIKCRGVNKYIGLFDDELSASKAYDKAAFDLFGDFANLNHQGSAS